VLLGRTFVSGLRTKKPNNFFQKPRFFPVLLAPLYTGDEVKDYKENSDNPASMLTLGQRYYRHVKRRRWQVNIGSTLVQCRKTGWQTVGSWLVVMRLITPRNI